MSAPHGTRAIFAALVANLGIAVMKFFAFVLSGSSSMLAESIHSVADSGNQLLLLYGGRRAKRAESPEHPFGYGSERYLSAFVVAIILFSLGGLFSLWEGWHKVAKPEPITSWQWVPFVVLFGALILEASSLRTALGEARHVRRRGESLLAFIRNTKAPELPVVLLEDLGALVGLVLALFGVSLTVLTGNGVWDGLGTLAIGALLIAIAVFLVVETKSLLVGEAASPQDIEAILAALADDALIERVIHLRTLHLGPEELLVAAKVAISRYDDAREMAAAIDAAEARIRAAVPIARLIFLEPDLDRELVGGTPLARFVLVARSGDADGARAIEPEAWRRWTARLGSAVLDPGGPLGAPVVVGEPAVRVAAMTGYAVLLAESLETARMLAEGCPVVGDWGSVEVHPVLPFP